MIRRPRRRPGYTLIELLVASAIATLLMLALYSSFDLTVNQTNIGRERVAHTDLARAVINRMSGDLSSAVGLLPPQSGQKPPESGSASGAAAGAAPAATDPAMMTTDPAAATGTLLDFQGGVIGDNQQVTLFVSKVPVWLTQPAAAAAAEQSNQTLPADLKRVTYYFAEGVGLCRQERPWVTATGTGDTTDLGDTDPQTEVISPEVTAVTFEYLDGTGWTTSWDGTGAALDDSKVLGPPRAVRVTLTFATTSDTGADVTKTVQHVFPVRAAIGLYTPPTGGQQP